MTEATSKKIEAALADPKLQSVELAPLFAKLSGSQKAFQEISKGMQELQQQLSRLRSEGDRVMGAAEAVTELIAEAMEAADAVASVSQ